MSLARAAKMMIVLLVCLGFIRAQTAAPPMLPDPHLTPGDILTTNENIVCQTGYTATVRDVTDSVKRAVFRRYGLIKRVNESWEVDHLVALELGGSNSILNLWPQAGFTTPLNFKIKDRLENALHDLVCAGQLSLQEAQKSMATNWAKAYKEFLGNLPNGIDPSSVTNTPNPATGLNPISSALGVPPLPDGSCPPEATVKVSRSGIFHLPGIGAYARTKAVLCFDTAEHARAAGYRPAR
jgi:hypothetical protein